MSHRRMAILELSLGLIREALQLPEEAEIIDATIDFDRRDRLLLKIEGAGWPVVEGELVKRGTGSIVTRYDATGEQYMPDISWDFAQEK